MKHAVAREVSIQVDDFFRRIYKYPPHVSYVLPYEAKGPVYRVLVFATPELLASFDLDASVGGSRAIVKAQATQPASDEIYWAPFAVRYRYHVYDAVHQESRYCSCVADIVTKIAERYAAILDTCRLAHANKARTLDAFLRSIPEQSR